MNIDEEKNPSIFYISSLQAKEDIIADMIHIYEYL